MQIIINSSHIITLLIFKNFVIHFLYQKLLDLVLHFMPYLIISLGMYYNS